MAKGMLRTVYYHQDPTFERVWGKFRKEAREAAEKKKAVAAFRVIATIRKIIRIAGYRLKADIVIQNVRTGEVYRSQTEDKRCR